MAAQRGLPRLNATAAAAERLEALKANICARYNPVRLVPRLQGKPGALHAFLQRLQLLQSTLPATTTQTCYF